MRFREQQEQARVATRVLVVLFAFTVLLTVAGVNAALALAWGLQFGGLVGYPRWFFETNTLVTLGFVLGGAWLESLQLRGGGAHVAELLGGREVVEPHTGVEKRLRNVVDEMAIASALKPPRVFVLDGEDAINALAAGWEPEDSVIAVTRGALERLTRDELQGVVAHEFAHILHGDTRLNMRLIGMVYGLQMVFTFGRMLMRVDDRGRRGPTLLAGLALVVAGSVGWACGRLLKAGVSREREHLADAAAVQFTRQPTGLGNALRKVAMQLQRGERIRHVNAEVVSHLLLSSDTLVAGGWLATHPPIRERVRRLFGRDMPPLADDPLPAEEPPARDLPPVPFAPGDMALVAASGAAATTAAVASEDQLAALALTCVPERLEAAVLALLLAPDELEQWQRTGAATDVWPALQSLAPRRRLPWFERLAACAATLAAASRAALLRRARDVVQLDARVSLREYLQWRVLQQLLAAHEPGQAAALQPLALQDTAAATSAVSLALAGLLPRQEPVSWANGVLRALALPTVPTGAAAPTELNGAIDRLARLARPQRPALVKQWLAALPPGDVPQAFADALRCLCLLIDTPLPPRLAACFDPLPAVAQAQPA